MFIHRLVFHLGKHHNHILHHKKDKYCKLFKIEITRSINMLFSCNQCDAKYLNKRSVSVHIRTIHEGVKFTCEQCDKVFARKYTLACHVKSKHLGIQYPCNLCSERFEKTDYLELI